MKKLPVVASLLLAVTVTLAVATVVFPLVAWLYPLEIRSEYDLDRAIRNSVALWLTLTISFAVQKLIRRFLMKLGWLEDF